MYEPKLLVRQPLLPRERLHQHARPGQIVPRDARKEVVRHLEVQPAVDERDVRVADDVRRRAQLPRGEGLGRAQVDRGHREVRQDDLERV